MRLIITVMMIIWIMGGFYPTPPQAGGQPFNTDSLSFVEDFQTVHELKMTLRRLNRELRSRHILAGLGDQVSGIDPDVLEDNLGVKTYPEFGHFSDREIEDQIIIIKEQTAGWETMTYNHSKLKDVFIQSPLLESLGRAPRIEDEDIIKLSHSVVAIIHKEYLKLQSDGTYHLTTEKLLTIGGTDLCSFSDFYNATCTKVAGTGFLIKPNLIATAGHVYDNADDIINDYYYVFDYKKVVPWKVKTTYTSNEVYEGKALVRRMNLNGNDFAVIELVRAVEGRDPLVCRGNGLIDASSEVYLLGHPFGLPLKYAGVGTVLDNSACNYFTCNLSSYQYNSGSPVFSIGNAATGTPHLVEGILCRDIGPEAESYCNCDAPSLFKAQYGTPGVQITRSFMFKSYLERPDDVLVRLDESLFAACIRTGSPNNYDYYYFDTSPDTPVPRERLIPYDDIYPLELLFNPEANCWATVWPARGDSWIIRKGPDAQKVMVKVCE